MADPSMAFLQFWQLEPEELGPPDEDNKDDDTDELEVVRFGGDESLVEEDRVVEDVLAAAPGGVLFCNLSSN